MKKKKRKIKRKHIVAYSKQKQAEMERQKRLRRKKLEAQRRRLVLDNLICNPRLAFKTDGTVMPSDMDLALRPAFANRKVGW